MPNSRKSPLTETICGFRSGYEIKSATRTRTRTRILAQKGGGWVLFFLFFWASVCFAEKFPYDVPTRPVTSKTRQEVKKPLANFTVNPLIRLKNSKFQVLAGRKEPNSAIYVNDQEVIPQNPYNSWYYEYPLSGNSTNIIVGMAFVPKKQVAKASPKDAAPLDVEPPVILNPSFNPFTKDFTFVFEYPRGVLAFNIYYANSLNPSGATTPFILAQSNYPVSGGGMAHWRDDGTYTKIHPADPSIKMRIYKLEVAKVDTTPPPEPSVYDDGISTFNSTKLRGIWFSEDLESGLAVEYQYKISRDSPSGSVVVDWTSAGDSKFVTKSGLTLEVGKTYYFSVKAKNAVGLWSGIGFSDGITVVSSDTTPPTGSIKINNDATYTNTTSVTLNLSAKDNSGGSGLSQMQLSNDNKNWSSPEDYSPNESWILTSGDGTKTVYIKFSDAADNWSEPTSDTIILNTTPLLITGITPNDGSSFYEGDTVMILVSASYDDIPSLEYQFSINNITKQAWSSSSTYRWQVLKDDIGSVNVKCEVRSKRGQEASRSIVYKIMVEPSSTVSVTEIEAVIGTVKVGSETVSSLPITVTNNTPGLKVNYSLSLVNPPGWTNSQAVAGVDTYILNAAFSNDASKINWDNAKHALSTIPVVCSAAKFAGDQTGINVVYNEPRKLWFQFKAPTSTTASTEQGIIIRITAEVSS